MILLDAGRPLTIAGLLDALHTRGFAAPGRQGKTVSDVLRAEVKRGRVVKVSRGGHRAGEVARVTRHRMRRRVAEALS